MILDLGVSRVFDSNQGLLTFLTRSMKCNKLYKEANVKVLELFEKIISEQTKIIAQYVPAVIEVKPIQFDTYNNVKPYNFF